MITNTKFHNFIRSRIIKANRNKNKYLDVRSGLSETDRINTCIKFAELEAFYEKLLLNIEVEPFIFKPILKKSYIFHQEYYKGDFRPNDDEKSFENGKDMQGNNLIINY